MRGENSLSKMIHSKNYKKLLKLLHFLKSDFVIDANVNDIMVKIITFLKVNL